MSHQTNSFITPKKTRVIKYDQYGTIDVLHSCDLPMPVINDDEVLIRVSAVSLNPFDRKLRTGELDPFFTIDFPVIPGRDGCGEIVKIGKDAHWKNKDKLQLGKQVCFISSRIQQGALADFVAVKAASFAAPLPQNMTLEACAALPLIGVSAYCALVETAELAPKMKILIHGGSGGVGSMAIQLALNIGADVYSTCSQANLDYVESLGATAIPYDSCDFTQVIQDYDVVFDTVGGDTHEKSYQVIKNGGRLVYLIAKPFKDVSSDFDVDTRRVNVMEKPDSLHKVVTLATSGIILPNVSDSFPFSRFKEAFQLMETGNPSGKVIISIDNSKQEK